MVQFDCCHWLYFIVLTLSFIKIHASVGDRSYVHQKCVHECVTGVCKQYTEEAYAAQQQWCYRFFRWTCKDDCSYDCMWKTVDAFRRDGSKCPQFGGKWPFIRFAGMQEPASVLFSLLNAIPNVFGLIKLRRTVPSTTPMYYAWQFHFVISINAWIWSIIFHCRDTNFTEHMDYFCATLLVMMSVSMILIRVFGSRVRSVTSVGLGALGAFYVYHVYYLSMVNFDYGYNMRVMISIGIANSIMWLVWCYNHRRKQRYVWKAAATIVLANMLLTLEAFDFPPLWWIFDAHSLWHAGTAPLVVLWASFVIDDLKFVNKQLD